MKECLVIGFICATLIEGISIISDNLDDWSYYESQKCGFYSRNFKNRKVILAISGVGSVNAAVCCMLLKRLYSPSIIVNFGTCGACNPKLKSGDLIFPKRIIWNDYVKDRLNSCYEKSRRDFFNDSEESVLKKLALCNGYIIHEAVLISVSDFIENEEKTKMFREKEIDAVDMEAGAIVQVCNRADIKTECFIIKIVIDESEMTFNTFDDYLQIEKKILEHNKDSLRELLGLFYYDFN